jgi:hypothetical protein
MKGLFRTRRLLNEQDRVLFRGPFDALGVADIADALTRMHVTSYLVDRGPPHAVVRSPELTVSWMLWYAREQHLLYLEDVAELEHALTLLLIEDERQEQLDLVFRLSKAGRGNIQYRITVQRKSEESFLCYEG